MVWVYRWKRHCVVLHNLQLHYFVKFITPQPTIGLIGYYPIGLILIRIRIRIWILVLIESMDSFAWCSHGMRNAIPSKMRGLCSRRYMFYIYYHILIIIILCLKSTPLKLRGYVSLHKWPIMRERILWPPMRKWEMRKRWGKMLFSFSFERVVLHNPRFSCMRKPWERFAWRGTVNVFQSLFILNN